jgi:sporulation protein YlmC with PRC-barrel domain
MATNTYLQAAAGDPDPAIVRDRIHHHSDGPGPDVMDAASLTGDDVVNADGDALGKIQAIMLDVPSGRIAYAALSYGGTFGMGDKLFAIPWSALILDAVHKRFVLNVSKERLDSEPGFDKDHWPSMADETWAAEVQNNDEPPYLGDDPVSASSG